MKHLRNLDIQTHAFIHQTIFWTGCILIVISCAIGERGELPPFAWLGIVIAALGIVWRILFIKCPHCESSLYNARGIPEYCPDCGGKIL